jgi:hypothetical protein
LFFKNNLFPAFYAGRSTTFIPLGIFAVIKRSGARLVAELSPLIICDLSTVFYLDGLAAFPTKLWVFVVSGKCLSSPYFSTLLAPKALNTSIYPIWIYINVYY